MSRNEATLLQCFILGMSPNEAVDYLIREGYQIKELQDAAKSLLQRIKDGEFDKPERLYN